MVWESLEKAWSMVKAQQLARHPWIICSWDGMDHGCSVPTTHCSESQAIFGFDSQPVRIEA